MRNFCRKPSPMAVRRCRGNNPNALPFKAIRLKWRFIDRDFSPYEHCGGPPYREQPYRVVRLRAMLHGSNPNGTPANSWGLSDPEYPMSHLQMVREILSNARYGMPGQIGQLF